MKEKTTIEKNAAEKQAALLSAALGNAVDADRYWLNASGRGYPRLYPKGVAVSPFNAVVMCLDADAKGCKTNLFTLYSEARARGESVREHEKGVPFLFYNWDKYVNRNNPNDIITRADYQKLDAEGQKQYKGIHHREVRTLFNIDQTVLPMSDADKYEKLLNQYGGEQYRAKSDKDEKDLRMKVNTFLQKMRENLVPIRKDGSGLAHYDVAKDVVYIPRQKEYEHYNDYVQDVVRQVVSATGHQQRLAREGMVNVGGKAPSEDAVKQERLVAEIATGVKMMELGLPARLQKDSLGMVDYWQRELKENLSMVDAIEADVNNTLTVLHKAERGEKIEYATMRHQQETAAMSEQMPKHYFVADAIKDYPNEESKTVVVVRDDAGKIADVVLPQGASLEVNNEIKGMSKQRYASALQKEGYDTVRFYNPDGALGYRPDDSYFADKKITVSRLKNWSLEDLSSLDSSEAVAHSKEVGFDTVQMLKDDKDRWALYIKPEGKDGFAVYPDKGDLNQFFTTLRQSMDTIENLRVELAQKYYALAETKPELKVDLFSPVEMDIDLNKIERVAVFKAKNGVYLCAATIDGQKMQPRSVSPAQWQRMWVAPDKDEYKKHLAATLFADVLREGKKESVSPENISQETISQGEGGKASEARETTESTEEKREEENDTEKKSNKTEKAKDVVASAAMLKQYMDLKAKHPDALLLFRVGDFYETYNEDAAKASKILGINLIDKSKDAGKGESLSQIAGFPHHALDSYLPKLIRAGERVAICDQLEEPKKQVAKEEKQEERSGGMRR